MRRFEHPIAAGYVLLGLPFFFDAAFGAWLFEAAGVGWISMIFLPHVLVGVGVGLIFDMAGHFFSESFGIGLIFTAMIILLFGVVWTVFDGIENLFKRVNQPRGDVHHYHRITIDKQGNPTEHTEYTERHLP